MDANAFDIGSAEPTFPEAPVSERKPAPAGPSFRVKDGARVRARDAALLASVMARLTDEGRGTAPELVAEARRATSPIHHCFEWDDAKAADAHRIEQAKHYWKAIEIVIQLDDSTERRQRAFHPVFVDGARRYESIGTIAQTDSLLNQLVAQAKKDLVAFKHRYQTLRDTSELAEVFAAIERLP